MRVRKKLGVCYVLMVLLTIAIVIPIIWLVFISMKPNSEIMNNPLSLPNARWTLGTMYPRCRRWICSRCTKIRLLSLSARLLWRSSLRFPAPWA